MRLSATLHRGADASASMLPCPPKNFQKFPACLAPTLKKKFQHTYVPYDSYNIPTIKQQYIRSR